MKHTMPPRRWALNGKLAIPILTLLIVFCSRATLAQSPPTGPAGGDLTGTYPNPTLAVDRVRKTGDTIIGNIDISVPNGGGIPVPFTVSSYGNALLNRGTAMGFNVPLSGSTSLLGGKITSAWGTGGKTYMSFSAYNNGAFPEIFRMDSGGFFGIGTTNPTSKLHVVSGTDSATSMLSLDTGVHGGTAMTVGGTVNNESTFGLSVYRAGTYTSRFGVSSAGNVYLQPGGGNVGIGTTAPAVRFQVDQSGTATTNSVSFLQPSLASGNSNWLVIGRAAADGQSGVMGYSYNSTTSSSFLWLGNYGDTLGTSLNIKKGGNVGIGTTAPASKLEVAGTIHSTTGGFKFPDGSVQTTAGGGGVGSVTSVFNRVGVVTAAQDDYTWAQINKSAANAGDLAAGTLLAARMPALTGDVTTSVGTVATILSNTGVTAGSYTNANITVNSKGRITAASNGSGGSTAFSDITAGTNTGALLVSGSLGVSGTGTINATSLSNAENITSGTVAIARLGTGAPGSTTFLRGDNTWTAITSSQWTTNGSNINYAPAGNVGIGVTGTPAEKLHVVGNGKITGSLTVDGTINAKYQDLAEWVPSSEQLSAGTVVALDTTKSNQVIASAVSYDTRVAGVISAEPGITLGEGGKGKVLVATTGRVRVKVDASRGAIQIGDLLVTSDVSGVAMKSEAVNLGGVQIHRPGTIIGKALEPLTKGKGEILVLLSLQ